MSNPAVQSRTTSDSSKGTGLSMAPRTAIHAPVGAIDKHQPSTRCESSVQRFEYEYNNTLASANGASSSVKRFSIAAATKKSIAEIKVNAQTKPTDKTP